MKTLREIFYSQYKFADKYDPYFDVYETWFAKFRGRSPRVLEIGVQHGGSANMWLDYFGAGTKVMGVDLDTNCLQHATDDITVVIGDQGDSKFWQQFLTKHPERYDIVIDDGGHRMQEMIQTFMAVSQLIDAGGIYIIEDTHTAYWSDASLYPAPHDDFGLYNPNNVLEFTKDAVDVLNLDHIVPHRGVIQQIDASTTQLYRNVIGLHYYNSMIVFEMGPQVSFTRCLNSGIKMQ